MKIKPTAPWFTSPDATEYLSCSRCIHMKASSAGWAVCSFQASKGDVLVTGHVMADTRPSNCPLAITPLATFNKSPKTYRRCSECKYDITDLHHVGNRYPPNCLCWDCWRKTNLYAKLAEHPSHCPQCKAFYHCRDWEIPKYHDHLIRNYCPECGHNLLR